MATTRVVSGQLREIWCRDDAQGDVSVTITTGIRVPRSSVLLSRVRGFLVVLTSTGTPIVTATCASNAAGYLQVTITNSAPGTTFTWQLDIEWVHSVQQAKDVGAGGIVSVVNGVIGSAPSGEADAVRVLAAPFECVAGGLETVTGITVDLTAGQLYMVDVEVSNYHTDAVNTMQLALGGTVVPSFSSLWHTIRPAVLTNFAPADTTNAASVIGVHGDAGLVTYTPPAAPGYSVWRISGVLAVQTAGTLLLRANTVQLGGIYGSMNTVLSGWMRVHRHNAINP